MMVHAGYNVLRFGTAYGQSQQMRYDLMINAMVRNAIINGEINVWNSLNWRPFAHVNSIAYGIGLTLKGMWNKPVQHVVEFNATIGGIAKRIGDILGVPIVIHTDKDPDERSYRVEPNYIEQEGHFEEKIKEIADNVMS